MLASNARMYLSGAAVSFIQIHELGLKNLLDIFLSLKPWVDLTKDYVYTCKCCLRVMQECTWVEQLSAIPKCMNKAFNTW